MAIYPIITTENRNIRRKATRVPKVDDGIRQLMDDMVETMLDAPGVGLAATQIDVHLRVFVMYIDEKYYYLANPEIIRTEGTQIDYEGCLSVPGYYGEVERAEKVVVKGLNRQGKTIRISGTGLLARCIQHELDHLDGTLYVDKLTDPKTLHIPKPNEIEEEL